MNNRCGFSLHNAICAVFFALTGPALASPSTLNINTFDGSSNVTYSSSGFDVSPFSCSFSSGDSLSGCFGAFTTTTSPGYSGSTGAILVLPSTTTVSDYVGIQYNVDGLGHANIFVQYYSGAALPLTQSTGYPSLPRTGGAVDITGIFSDSMGVIHALPDGLTITVTAVPEPETYAMMLAGLGLLGFAARRRKQQAS
jgi:hypothetical protein